MAPTSTALTVKAQSGSPYQLSHEQTLKASKALLAHIKSSEQEKSKATAKKSLIKDDSDSEEDEDSASEPIWLLLTTKKHMVDQKRLKPTKIALPHPLNTSETSTICLITADPQRTYKDLVQSHAFPTALSKRITKVVGVKKIQKKWTQYEAQRKLFAEHDIFLADDRIITRLPKLLGKTFYGNMKKRPIPISIQAQPAKTEEKKITKAQQQGSGPPAGPKVVAAAIEKAMQCAIVNLNASTHTPVIVGYAHWSAEKLTENIEAVAEILIEKYVPKKWRGVKAFHVKGATTAALPIWLADELWVDDADVMGEEQVKTIEEAKVSKKRKGRALEGGAVQGSPKEKKQKLLESNDDKLDAEIKARKEKLKLQKLEAMMDEDADSFIPKASKKSKKAETVAV